MKPRGTRGATALLQQRPCLVPAAPERHDDRRVAAAVAVGPRRRQLHGAALRPGEASVAHARAQRHDLADGGLGVVAAAAARVAGLRGAGAHRASEVARSAAVGVAAVHGKENENGGGQWTTSRPG